MQEIHKLEVLGEDHLQIWKHVFDTNPITIHLSVTRALLPVVPSRSFEDDDEDLPKSPLPLRQRLSFPEHSRFGRKFQFREDPATLK